MGPPPGGRSSLIGPRSVSPPAAAVSRAQPIVDNVRPSNIRQAAETLAPMRLQLNDPEARRDARAGSTERNGDLANTRATGRYLVREEEVTTADGDIETICIYTRPDGVEVISRHVQTEFNKRHAQMGIVFRSKSMSWIAIFILFLSPVLVILSICSFYINWRPLFQLWNAEANGEFEGGSPPLWLLYLEAANFYFLILTYLCVMPTAFKCIISDDEGNAYRDVLISVAMFVIAFLPVWIGELGITWALPYDASHDGTWATAIVFWVGGFLMYGIIWYVYSTYMAELLHSKARKAADEYLRALQLGLARRRLPLNKGYSRAPQPSPTRPSTLAVMPNSHPNNVTAQQPQQQRSQEPDPRSGVVGY